MQTVFLGLQRSRPWITQALYEEKLITYPRTDSRFLTDDMETYVKSLVPLMTEKFGFTGINAHVGQVIIIRERPSRFNSYKNSAKTDLGELPSGETKMLSLIAARLLAAVGDPYVYEETALEAIADGTVFKAKGKVEKHKGYKAVHEWILGKSTEEKETDSSNVYMNVLEEGKSYPLREPRIKEGKTTPKIHFTEDALLANMECADNSDNQPECRGDSGRLQVCSGAGVTVEGTFR